MDEEAEEEEEGVAEGKAAWVFALVLGVAELRCGLDAVGDLVFAPVSRTPVRCMCVYVCTHMYVHVSVHVCARTYAHAQA